MEKKIFKYLIKVFILTVGLSGWLPWLYIFWDILLNPHPQGFYLNPFRIHEFWFEFIMIHVVVILMSIGIIKIAKEDFFYG